MRLGHRVGDPVGAVEESDSPGRFSAVSLQHVPALGPRAFRLSWNYAAGHMFGTNGGRMGDPLGGNRDWFKVYVNGRLHRTQRGQVVDFVAPDAGQVLAAVVAVGPLSGDPDYDPGLTDTIPGDRVQLDWQPPAYAPDVREYRIYWDSGGGTVSYTTPLAVVPHDGRAAYTWVSAKLTDGTYKFVVRSVDIAGNVETNVAEVNQAIATWPATPTGLAYSDITVDPGVSFTVDLAWSGGMNVNVYGNDHAGGDIDYSTPIDTNVSSPWTSAALTDGPGVYRFAVRGRNATYEEKNTDFIEFEVNAAFAEVSRPLSPYGLTVIPAAGAEFTVSGKLDKARPVINGRTPAAAANVKVYHDNGTGTMDWNTAVGTATLVYQAGRWSWTFTTSAGAYSDQQLVKFGARANTANDVTDENTDTATGRADGIAPDAPRSLAASAVRSKAGGLQ